MEIAVTLISFAMVIFFFCFGWLYGIETCAKYVHKRFIECIILAILLGFGLAGVVLMGVFSVWFLNNGL